MATEEKLMHAFANGLDAAARVRVRRPGRIYQVELPAYLADGDVAEIYVRTDGPRMVVTDLGTTRMRLSYTRAITSDVDADLAALAESQGFRLERGELVVEVGERELLAAALGLIQIEAQADRLLTGLRKRAREASQFREVVIDLLREVFAKVPVREGFHDEKADPEALYAVDALIETPTPLAIATISADIAAERAIIAKAHLGGVVGPRAWWLAIPKNYSRLSAKTQARLMKAYQPVGHAFADDKAEIAAQLRKYAAAA